METILFHDEDDKYQWPDKQAGMILCMRPANERWGYSVTPSLIGGVHALNNPC